MNKELLEAQIEKHIKLVKEEAGAFNLMLSGGVDSGTLAAMGDPDVVISVRLPYGDRYDEYEDMEKTVKHLGLEDRWVVLELDNYDIHQAMREAVKAIGRPIPHFNIFPLFVAYRAAEKMGLSSIVVGDGPDESMAGYTRHLIMKYLYDIYDFEAFYQYAPTIDKIFGGFEETYATLIGKTISEVKPIMDKHSGNLRKMCAVDMDLMREDMDDMGNKIAQSFGLEIYRPLQYPEIDDFMFNLPDEDKIHKVEFGKYLLRRVAADYLPEEIAWRKQKIGGPLVPMNKLLGIDEPEFSKKGYLEYQEKILNEVR
jgi:asparagine synthetase B (glutamine-hydrolysing)